MKNTSLILILLLIGCKNTSKSILPKKALGFTPVEEVVTVERTTKVLEMASQPDFINTITDKNVARLLALEKTGFHFYNNFQFKTSDIAVLAGGAGLRATITTNGGRTWTENSFSRFANPFHAVAFSGKTMFVVGESEYIFKSTDLGKSWSVFNTEVFFENLPPYSQFKYYKIRFFNEQVGFIAGEFNGAPILLKTDDAGNNWTILKDNGTLQQAYSITDFIVRSPEELIVVTGSGKCYKSDGAIGNWKLLYALDKKSPSLNSIAFLDDKIGFIGGRNGVLFYTNDRGTNWKKIKMPILGDGINANVSDIVFHDDMAYITTSKSFSDKREAFVYTIDKDATAIKPFLMADEETIDFVGDSFSIDVFNDTLYVMDRNALYKTQIK